MHAMSRNTLIAALLAVAGASHAADWSDTSMGFRFGDKYAEPFNTEDIAKKIVNFTHASGYKYGSNFFNADFLMSDDKDPSSPSGSSGAAEIYVVYRHTLDIGKVTGSSFKYGPMRGFGVTAGFDFNVKDDAGYNSKKRMFVAGPTLMMDLPGFLNISLLALWESNAPNNEYAGTSVSRYHYDVHPMLNLAWGIPIGAGFSFEGFANFIASKGDNEFGGDTGAETNIDMQIMYDLSPVVGAGKGTFKVGLEYQYWKNKFGNKTTAVGEGAGPGATAKTPQIRMEYHF